MRKNRFGYRDYEIPRFDRMAIIGQYAQEKGLTTQYLRSMFRACGFTWIDGLEHTRRDMYETCDQVLLTYADRIKLEDRHEARRIKRLVIDRSLPLRQIAVPLALSLFLLLLFAEFSP